MEFITTKAAAWRAVRGVRQREGFGRVSYMTHALLATSHSTQSGYCRAWGSAAPAVFRGSRSPRA